MNWVGAKLEEDAFGAAMLKAGIPAETIMAWTKDPQVEFEGAKGSLFDYLEDLNCDECLSKAMKIAGVTGDVPACAKSGESAWHKGAHAWKKSGAEGASTERVRMHCVRATGRRHPADHETTPAARSFLSRTLSPLISLIDLPGGARR